MNIYEDEQLERTLRQVTDQLGFLILDALLISLKKVNIENQILKEFESAREKTFLEDDTLPF